MYRGGLSDCHLVRERVESNVIATLCVPTGAQVTNMFTKLAGQSSFGYFLTSLNLVRPKTLQKQP